MIAILLLLSQYASAQDATLGAKVFAQTCAVGYCHGTAGAANRGPRLAGRGFDRPYIEKVLKEGIPGTAMPSFKQLKPEEFSAVVAYVVQIGGGAGSAPAPPPFVPSAEPPAFPGPEIAKRGRDLFFDPVRGTRCGTCHAVQDWGTAVGPNLTAKPPVSADAIRAVNATHVQQAVNGSERFPALLVERRGGYVQVYDLTSTPPVLRTFPQNAVTLQPGATWKHTAAISSYSTADLEAVASYLRWASTQR